MRIGLLYEPVYSILLEALIQDLEHEVCLVGGESVRLTPADVNSADVDVIYSLLCDCTEVLKHVEKRLPVINLTRAQEIAIDKITTSRLLVGGNLPTPETIISQTPVRLVHALNRYGILLLKSTHSCGGAGHRVLRRCGEKISTISQGRVYHLVFGDRNRIRGETITAAPPYYGQRFIGGVTEQTNNRVFHLYVVGNQVGLGTVRVKTGVDTPEKSIGNITTGAFYELLPAFDDEMERLALSVAHLIGFETGAVDFLRDPAGRTFIIEADCDGRHLFIYRKFQDAAGYSETYNLNAYIARHLAKLGAHAAKPF